MEHSVSRPIINRLIKFVEYFQACPMSQIHWDEDEGYFCGGGDSAENSAASCGRDICGHKGLKFKESNQGESKK